MFRLIGTYLLAALVVVSASSGITAKARAQACGNNYQTPIPNCQEQQMAPVHYGTWQTLGWAYYCSGDHPYFWGYNDNYPGNYSKDNGCFSISEDYFVETAPNKFDATITNWCLRDEDLVITIGCSTVEPPSFASSCPHESSQPIKDPGCPQSNEKNYCSPSNPPVCFQTFTETCGTKVYDCTIDLLVTWCYACQ